MSETYQDHYRILGVYRSATEEDIKFAYRQLIRKYHPDSNKSVSDDNYCKKINNAYSVLLNEETRAAFDYIYDKRNSLWQPRVESSKNWIEAYWKQIGIFIGGTTVLGFGAYYLTKKMWYMSSSTADLILPTPCITIEQEVPLKNLENSLKLFSEITKIDNIPQYVTASPLVVPILNSIRSSFVIMSRAWQNILLFVDATTIPEPVAKSATFIENQATAKLTEKLQQWTAGLTPSSASLQGTSNPEASEEILSDSVSAKATSKVVTTCNWTAASAASLASRLRKSKPEAKDIILSAASTIAKAAGNLRKSTEERSHGGVLSMLSKLLQFINKVFLSILNFFFISTQNKGFIIDTK